MSVVTPPRARTWVLWVVRAVLALTVLNLAIGSISSIWMGARTGSFWWLVYTMPQVSIALLAVLICWTPGSRPRDLELNTGMVLGFGMTASFVFMRWLPLMIGAVAILAFFVRPQRGKFIHDGPPPNLGSRQRQ